MKVNDWPSSDGLYTSKTFMSRVKVFILIFTFRTPPPRDHLMGSPGQLSWGVEYWGLPTGMRSGSE